MLLRGCSATTQATCAAEWQRGPADRQQLHPVLLSHYRNINTLVLKSYIHSAAIFGGICHPFRGALSSVVNLYSATGINPRPLESIFLGLNTAPFDLGEAGLALSNLSVLRLLHLNERHFF